MPTNAVEPIERIRLRRTRASLRQSDRLGPFKADVHAGIPRNGLYWHPVFGELSPQLLDGYAIILI